MVLFTACVGCEQNRQPARVLRLVELADAWFGTLAFPAALTIASPRGRNVAEFIVNLILAVLTNLGPLLRATHTPLFTCFKRDCSTLRPNHHTNLRVRPP